MHELISTGNKWSWKLIEVSQDTQPSPRLYHVLSSVNNGFFIYRGRSEDNKVSATLFHHSVEHSAFDALPIETILHIFSFLKPKDLARVAVVCKLWKEISESDDLWKPRVIEAIGDIAPYKETLEEMKTFKKFYVATSLLNCPPVFYDGKPIIWRNPAFWGKKLASWKN